jgi:hypothetical protein
VIDAIGISDLDPCGYKLNGHCIVRTAKHNFLLERGQDGLKLPWFGNVFCNPPYSDVKPWIEECRKYHEDSGNDVILLVFPRTSAGWFVENVPSATGMICVSPRLKFLTSEGKVQGMSPLGSLLIAFGENAYRRCKAISGIPFRVDVDVVKKKE